MGILTNPRVRYYGVLAVLLIVLAALYWNSLQALIAPFAGTAPFDLRFAQALLTLIFAVVVVAITRNLFFRLVSQFALPVDTPPERRKALEHFFRFSAGVPGPAIFVRDGELLASATEKEHRNVGAGVIVVDSVSAVVLRNDTSFTRAHGPGVVFTEPGEYIAAPLDLRKQVRTAENVSALTHDGITVSANLSVTFMLEHGRHDPFPTWEEGDSPPYYFDEFHALHAVFGSAVRDDRLLDWRELAPLVAADVWRELLLQRDLDSLFSKDKDAPPLLGSIIAQVQFRLKEDVESPEYKLLQDRGIRVLNVGYSGLRFTDEVKRLRMEQWQKDWQSRAGELAEDKDPEIRKVRIEGERLGRIEAVVRLTQLIREQLTHGGRPDLPDVLADLAARTRELAADPGVKKEINIADIQSILLNLEVWVDKYRTGNTQGVP